MKCFMLFNMLNNLTAWKQRAKQQWFKASLAESWRYTHSLWTDKDAQNVRNTETITLLLLFQGRTFLNLLVFGKGGGLPPQSGDKTALAAPSGRLPDCAAWDCWAHKTFFVCLFVFLLFRFFYSSCFFQCRGDILLKFKNWLITSECAR